jgi:hypothetical protein
VDQVVEKVDSPHRKDSAQSVPAAEIRRTLSAILQSAPFHSSKQTKELLQFIVEQTLTGHPEMLKERMIGANVFGRRPDYDTNDDPIVRARASEVRKRLALYYQSAPEEPIRIGIPSGSFRAIFEWADKAPAHAASNQQPGPEESHSFGELAAQPDLMEPGGPKLVPQANGIQDRQGLDRRFWIVIAALAVLLTWTTQHYFATSDERAFDQFWSPMLSGPKPVLIYIGSNAVYQLTSTYIDEYYKLHPKSQNEEMGLESYIPLTPGAKIDSEDLYPAKDTFVTIGDVAATTKIVTMLVRRDKQFDVRFANDVAYGDLRESPTILIGAHNNPWTLTMTENLRYVFDGHLTILDRSDSQKRWSAKDGFPEDYAIISRVMNTETGTTVITAAGIGFAGTRAAAEFLTDPHSIAVLVKSLPRGCEKKNIQIVLHTNVINQVPSAPDVVSTYCW